MVQFSVSPVAVVACAIGKFQFHNPSAEIVAAALLQANEEEIREIIPLHQVASVVFVVAFATVCSVFLGLLIAGPLGRRESPMNGLQFLDQKLETVIKSIDYFGTALFALSGSRTAGSRGMNLMGCVIVACITAMGGGTLAALFFGRPVSWVHEPEYVAIAVLVGIASFFLWPKIPVTIRTSKVMSKTLDWFDGICLSTFAVIGTDSALRNDSGILLALLSGVMTATFGGFTRDVVCRLPVRILHSHAEIYASCCLWAAALYTTLVMSAPALPAVVQVGIPILSTTFLRYLAWSNGLRLPVYKEEKPLF